MMAASQLTKQFHACLLLVELRLRQVAKDADLEKALTQATRDLGLLSDDDVSFYRACKADDEALQQGDKPAVERGPEDVHHLQMLAVKLNICETVG
ncbi:MAG: hypothetical protein SOV74_08285 [Coriobacteriales bacterium]|nr:hypothetical protein [Coriobacteriales bacterium]